MRPRLLGYAAAVLPAEPTASEELRAAVRSIEIHGALAKALSDVSIPVAARRGVVEELFAPRVSAPVGRLLVAAVELERADELSVALDDLLSVADELARHGDAGRFVLLERARLGRSGVRELLAGFAKGLLEGASVGLLEDAEDALFRLARLAETTTGLRRALGDPGLPARVRRNVATELLEGKVAPEVRSLVLAALSVRARDVVRILDALVEEVAAMRGWRVARIRSAMPLDAQLEARIRQVLASVATQPVELQVTVDPELVGGVVVAIGDIVADVTVARRLAELEGTLRRPAG
jgi:F-type H+-transporting ATPase subunit delta